MGINSRWEVPESERRRRADEGPIHTVILSDYWISTFMKKSIKGY